MRVGHNPNRNKGADHFEKVVFAVVTHLPERESAYHKDRMEVMQVCLSTMRDGAELPHTFMVWDNGSCDSFRDWLEWDFKPDIVIKSSNMGKTLARASMIKMLPPETIVAYSDDDMIFYPGWLQPQIEILETFPNVSVVSGYPVRTAFRWACENTIAWAEKNRKVKKGRFIPREWEDDFCVSIGRDPTWHATEYTLNDIDYKVTYKNKEVYLTSHHCQFVGYAGRIAPHLFYDYKAMGDEKPFDVAMDESGLRLCTTERYARHMGNKLDDKIRQELMVYA